MSSLLSAADILYATGVQLDLFNTFTSGIGSTIVVYKEPVRTISNASSINMLPGYESQIIDQTATYTQNSGTFYAEVRDFQEDQPFNELTQARTFIDNGVVSIKVRQEARDFINNGKTEKIIANGQTYNLNGTEKTQNFLGLKFYVYELKRTE